MTNARPIGLSDAEWEHRAARIREAVATYRGVDMEALADQALEEYRKGRDEGFVLDPVLEAEAVAASAAMIVQTEQRLSAGARDVARTYAGVPLPIVLLLGLVVVANLSIGVSSIPAPVIVAAYALGGLATLGVGWKAFHAVIGQPLVGRTRQFLPGLAVGMAIAVFAAPFAVHWTMASERMSVEQASSTFAREILAQLAQRHAGHEVRSDYVFDAPGLPGSLRGEIGETSGEIYWTTGLGKKSLLSRVEVGTLHKKSGGWFEFITAGHQVKTVTASSTEAFFLPEGQAAVVLDAKEQKLMDVKSLTR